MRIRIWMESGCRAALTAGLVCLVIAAGCGGGGSGDQATAAVSGKVTRDGQPVAGGSVMFSPIGKGKPAAADVNQDGSYRLTTYRSGDGAIVGKHRVTFTPPPTAEIDEKEHKEGSPPPKSPYDGLVPKTAEVEVKSGSNTIDIELVPGSKTGS